MVSYVCFCLEVVVGEEPTAATRCCNTVYYNKYRAELLFIKKERSLIYLGNDQDHP